MGVRLGKLTPASQGVINRTLTHKAGRSGPIETAGVPLLPDPGAGSAELLSSSVPRGEDPGGRHAALHRRTCGLAAGRTQALEPARRCPAAGTSFDPHRRGAGRAEREPADARRGAGTAGTAGVGDAAASVGGRVAARPAAARPAADRRQGRASSSADQPFLEEADCGCRISAICWFWWWG